MLTGQISPPTIVFCKKIFLLTTTITIIITGHGTKLTTHRTRHPPPPLHYTKTIHEHCLGSLSLSPTIQPANLGAAPVKKKPPHTQPTSTAQRGQTYPTDTDIAMVLWMRSAGRRVRVISRRWKRSVFSKNEAADVGRSNTPASINYAHTHTYTSYSHANGKASCVTTTATAVGLPKKKKKGSTLVKSFGTYAETYGA